MKNLIKRSFDKLVKITGIGYVKGIFAYQLMIGDEILEKSGEVTEVIGADLTSTGLSIKLETKHKLTGALQKRTVRRETVFALLDQNSLSSRNQHILNDINNLSSGTIAFLTGFDKYEVIDKIRLEFYDWAETVQKDYENWKQAWRGFNSPEVGLYSFPIYDVVEEAQKEPEVDRRTTVITEVKEDLLGNKTETSHKVERDIYNKAYRVELVTLLDGTTKELINTRATVQELKSCYGKDIDFIITVKGDVIEIADKKQEQEKSMEEVRDFLGDTEVVLYSTLDTYESRHNKDQKAWMFYGGANGVKIASTHSMIDGKEFANTNEAKRFLTKEMEFRKVSQELLFKEGKEIETVESSDISLLPTEASTQTIFEKVKEIPEEMEFIIADSELPKLERLVKKSEKMGEGLTVTIVPDKIEKVELEYQTIDVQLHKVTLKRPTENKVEDYRIVGRVTVTGLDENIVESYWGVDFDFEQFKNCKTVCQHCNTNRYRKVLYLVQNLKSGEVLTVGRSCLGDIFKVADIERYIKYLEYCFELFKVGSELSMYGSGRDKFLEDELEKESHLSFLKTEDCLAYIKKIIDREGYVSKNSSYSSNRDATAVIMKNEFREVDIVSLGDRTSPELKKLVTKDVEFYIENQDTSTEYNKMLVDMVKNKYVLKSKAYLLSGFFISNDILKEKLKRDKLKEVSQFIGEKGAKVETRVEFIRVASFKSPFSYYDYTNIYIFKDLEGNVLTWKTTKELELNQGDKLDIQCTIKDHTVYDGEKQTVVIRLKIKK